MNRLHFIAPLALFVALPLCGCNLVLDPDDHRGGSLADGPCGDGITEFPETCDDGNAVSGDGCSAVCQDETLYCDPRTVGTLDEINYAYRILATAQHVFSVSGPLSTPGQLRIADVNDPTLPIYRGHRQAPTGYDGWQAKSIAADNGHLWMTGSDPRFTSYDISVPSAPLYTWAEGPNSYGSDIARRDDILIVTDTDSGPARFYRTNSNGTPTYLGSYGNPMAGDIYYTVGIGQNIAYGGENSGNIDLWNVSNLAAPVFRATYVAPDASKINRMVGTDTTVFAAMEGGGIRAIDISNPTVPELRDTYGAGQSFRDIALLGDFVYAANDAGLIVLDVSDPADLRAAASNSVPGEIGRSVAIDPPYAFISVDGPLRVVADLPGMCDAVCGNTQIEYPEDCDDGNHADGDGCSAGCQTE